MSGGGEATGKEKKKTTGQHLAPLELVLDQEGGITQRPKIEPESRIGELE